MSEEKQGVWFGGLPTDIDVQKIVAAVGKPDLGQLVTYEELERITGLHYGESRYLSVVGAWRRLLMREHNLVTQGIRNEGILICDNGQRVDHCGNMLEKAVRGLRRTYKTAASTPRGDLTVEKVRRLDHTLNVSGSLMTHGKQISDAARKAEGKLVGGTD